MNTKVEFEDGDLVIRVPKDFVYATIVYNQNSSVVDPSDSNDFPEQGVLVDFEEFSVDLLSSIRSEDETGWSLVNELIYKASEDAFESGARGVDWREG